MTTPGTHNEWDRQPSESARAFAAFCVYRDDGPGRSLRGVVDKTGTKLAQIGVLSRRYRWVSRVEAYDAHMARLEQAAREQALEAEAQKWAQRRLEQREREWETAKTLQERAMQMLAHPMTRTKTEDGKSVIVPAGWWMRDIPAFVDLASKLARLASEMETDRQKHEHELDDMDAALERFNRRIVSLSAGLGTGADTGHSDPAPTGGAAV